MLTRTDTVDTVYLDAAFSDENAETWMVDQKFLSLKTQCPDKQNQLSGASDGQWRHFSV